MKYEPIVRNPTDEEKELFTAEFLESLFEDNTQYDENMIHIKKEGSHNCLEMKSYINKL